MSSNDYIYGRNVGGQIQICQPNISINEIQVEIFNEKGNYGGAVRTHEHDNHYPWEMDTLHLYFENYEGFKNFYNSIIKLKQGIDKYIFDPNISI